MAPEELYMYRALDMSCKVAVAGSRALEELQRALDELLRALGEL